MKQAKQFGAAGWQFGANRDAAEAAVPGTDEVAVTDVTYSDEVVAELIYMIEEEKLAGDIYEAFYELYGLRIFANIARSEDSHFNALVKQAEAMGLDTDQFVYNEAGRFEDPELQALYDDLIATGALSLTSALEVGAAIESKDITDIAAAIETVEGTALEGVYANLLAGSESHLAAFEGVLG
ncbi:DUF2202 domain-containing protein [Mameliella alba]|nr:DUF2202 domain-containing protein [Mameliella alba]MBY6169249.1 DUF2202 domain-containing protein [Mameliella alba]MBY6173530.1 DUF2202 domain-containing protein [Mameliella alba]